MQTKRATAAGMGLLLLGLLGCSGSQWAEVSGKVTVEDKPVTAGRITFVHEDGRTALAEIKADGTYHLEKAPAGNVKVGIVSMNFAYFESKMPKRYDKGKMQDPNNPNAAPPPALTPPPRGGVVSKRYENPKLSGLTANVKDGEHNKIDFPLKGGL